ncbi:MAG TPA: hypothetical protein VNL71_18410 [Chloroflexota bacterium]|nr:hypothetical protein [Chloroflexota bacterium]
MPKPRASDDTARWQGLPSGSPERRAAALRVVGSALLPDTLEGALAELADQQDTETRAAILARYDACYTDPKRGDSGCYVRSALLRALRPLALPADRALLEGAINTYEYLPPGRSEVASGLRAAALIALNEVDPILAGYHAVRLLWDARTSGMSGEPAVTAAALLGSQEQMLPLYAYLWQPHPAGSEVIGACLRNLTTLPDSLLSALIAQYQGSEDEIVLLGLSDLLLAHPARALCTPVLRELLDRPRLPNLFRYLVLTMRASRQDAWIAELKRLQREEHIPFRVEILREALT